MGSGSMDKVRAIPIGNSPQENVKRGQVYRNFDVNGNGYLSLAEVDKGCRDVLQLPELFDAKPVLMRAFQAAKTKLKSKSPHGDDYVSKGEFRFLLIYLRIYYEFWIDYKSIDVDGDRRIGQAEFTNGLPMLECWGVTVKDPVTCFQQLLKDNNAQAHLTFTQFSEWVIYHQLGLIAPKEDHNEL